MSWRGIKALGPPRLRQAVPGPGEWVSMVPCPTVLRELKDKALLFNRQIAMPRPDEGAVLVVDLRRSL